MAAVPEKSAPDALDLVAPFSAAPAATPGTSEPDALDLVAPFSAALAATQENSAPASTIIPLANA